MPSASLDCPYCGTPLASGVTQCPNCLNPIEAPAPEPAPVPEQPQVVHETAPDYEEKPANAPSDWRYVSLFAKIIAIPVLILLIVNIVMPVAHKAGETKQANQSVDKLKSIGDAVKKYAGDHEGKLPPMTTIPAFQSAIEKYLPNGKAADALQQPGSTSYYWINPSVSEQKLTAIKNPETVEVAEEVVPHEGHIEVLYADGHISMVSK